MKNSTTPDLHEYAFDCVLACAIRVKDQPSETAARHLLQKQIDAVEANLGAWPNGDPILAEVSVVFDNGPLDVPPSLYEIDGETVEGGLPAPDLNDTLNQALTLLQETLNTWEDEEDSVQREHAKHIRELKFFLDHNPPAPPTKDNPMGGQTVIDARLRGWKVEQYDQHIQLELDDRPGYITVKADDDGFAVCLMPDVGNEAVAEANATYDELEAD